MDTVLIVCCVYIIVYIVINIMEEPKMEYFSNSRPSRVSFIHAEPKDMGIRVDFTRPQHGENLLRYIIRVIDIGNPEGNIIPDIYFGNPQTLSLPDNHTILQGPKIRNGRTYKVLVWAQNSYGKSPTPIESNHVTPSRNAGTVPDSLPSGTDEAVQRDNDRMVRQESEQNIQNRVISDMKKRVDALRNDIVILKNKDKDEMRSVHNRIELDDTISQLPASVQDRMGMGIGYERPRNIDINFDIV